MDKWISEIKGLRKWSIMFLVIIIGVIFRVTALISGLEFVALIKGVAVAFMASNAIERTMERMGKKKENMDED